MAFLPLKGNTKINTIDFFGHILHQAEKSRHKTKLTLAKKFEVTSNDNSDTFLIHKALLKSGEYYNEMLAFVS